MQQTTPNRDVHEELSVEEAIARSHYESMEEVARDSVMGRTAGVPASCSCLSKVEPDGVCPGGNPSVLRKERLV